VILKPGVRVLGLRPEMVLALAVMDTIYTTHNQAMVVTSVIEGVHSRASLHYTGMAADLRRPADAMILQRIIDDAKVALGDDYDVVLEVDHVHVEFQPKAPY
jgi:NO-binding membrane sensor protein with MHYT domain